MGRLLAMIISFMCAATICKNPNEVLGYIVGRSMCLTSSHPFNRDNSSENCGFENLAYRTEPYRGGFEVILTNLATSVVADYGPVFKTPNISRKIMEKSDSSMKTNIFSGKTWGMTK